jgi:short-subunit dehydrogenase
MKNPHHILITGGSSGIGEALALHYAAPGITLHLSGRNEQRLLAVADAARAKGATVHTAVVDTTDRAAMARWIGEADHLGPLDLVIANAGISGGTAGPMKGEPIDAARKIFDVNLGGVLNTIEPVLPRMQERSKGQIAIISSLSAYRGWPGAPAYSASKGAVRFYGEALRGALHGSGVEVNVVCPGFVVSRMTDVNRFPMPFLMTAEKAARIIAKSLARNTGRIAFPLPTHSIAWLVSVFPDVLIQGVLRRLPAKSGL